MTPKRVEDATRHSISTASGSARSAVLPASIPATRSRRRCRKKLRLVVDLPRHLGRGLRAMTRQQRLSGLGPELARPPPPRGAGRALAHPSGPADRGIGTRRQSRRAGTPAGGKVHQHVRQALRRRERARRRRHRRRQHGRQVAARRACADVRRFRRHGDQPGAQCQPRLRPDQGLCAGHRAGQPADHHVGQSRRPTRSRPSSRSPRKSPAR